jgi:hypothetical protein
MRGVCSCKQGSYGSRDPTRKGGSDEGKSPKTELVNYYVWRVLFFWRDHRHVNVCTLVSPGAAGMVGRVRCMAVRPVRLPTPGEKFLVQPASTYINLPPPLARKSTF